MPEDARNAAVLPSLLVLALGAAVAPFVFHHYDVVDCFLAWSRASGGWRPWAIYLTDFRTDLDYPPVVPYLLTLVERLRLLARAPEVGVVSVLLVKLPNLLAAAAHGPIAAAGLREAYGPAASRVGVLLALSPALFVNAALWGQFDALLSLLVLAAVIALLDDRPAWAGAALGAALATKLLAIVVAPLALLWILRRSGARGALAALGSALLVMAVLALPYLLAGAGGPVLAAYRGAVDYYPFRTVEAYNGWYLLDRFDIFVRGMPSREARLDTRAAFGGAVTFHHLGLGLIAVYTAFLLALLWRRPTRAALAWTLVAQCFAFFMLPTQMHQRYILPAAVLAALLVPLSRRGVVLFAILAATATLNQGLDLGRAVLEQSLVVDPAAVADPPRWRAAIRIAATVVAVVNVGAFCWMTAVLPRETTEAR